MQRHKPSLHACCGSHPLHFSWIAGLLHIVIFLHFVLPILQVYVCCLLCHPGMIGFAFAYLVSCWAFDGNQCSAPLKSFILQAFNIFASILNPQSSLSLPCLPCPTAHLHPNPTRGEPFPLHSYPPAAEALGRGNGEGGQEGQGSGASAVQVRYMLMSALSRLGYFETIHSTRRVVGNSACQQIKSQSQIAEALPGF